ncbi:hypothetical protein NVP1121O_255 [Vibrio phage 1.121.O._10N.286.46.C4]|nr:hypothetical protein NVP1121O_255 [Vibrio phage 1.121.O._10N.286.46.C4]
MFSNLVGELFINSKNRLNPFIQDDPKYFVVVQKVSDALGEAWVKHSSGYMKFTDFLNTFTQVDPSKVDSHIVDYFGVKYTVKIPDLNSRVRVVTDIKYDPSYGLDPSYLKYKTVHKVGQEIKYEKGKITLV